MHTPPMYLYIFILYNKYIYLFSIYTICIRHQCINIFLYNITKICMYNVYIYIFNIYVKCIHHQCIYILLYNITNIFRIHEICIRQQCIYIFLYYKTNIYMYIVTDLYNIYIYISHICNMHTPPIYLHIYLYII